jgi:thiol-disulfide isomerase/thioredoxin
MNRPVPAWLIMIALTTAATACRRGGTMIDVAAAATKTPAPTTAPAAPESGPPVDVRRFHALLINGGGSPTQNYQSHHLHVATLVDQLRGGGLPADHIALFASDGTDPAADMAVRDKQPEANFWMLRGTPLEEPLRTPVTRVDAKQAGVTAAPATKAALTRWFAAAKTRLRPGDTLLLYVTDHGTGSPDGRNNAIVLWGAGQSLTVDDLGQLLATLDPGVRVVALMSQCFSGGFARLYQNRRANPAGGGFCGYFASTADRPAYGCYPENLDKNNVGHSFNFFAALAKAPVFPSAHRDVLVTDQTPDVPLSTSDAFLEDLLTRVAAAAKPARALPDLVDDLLRQAWQESKTWEPDIRLLDRVGQNFGMFSPRSLAELTKQAGTLPAFSKTVDSHKQAWTSALEDLNTGRLARFREANPAWNARLGKDELAALTPEKRRALTAELLAALEAFPLDQERLTKVHDRAEQTAALAYRLEVRQGAVLRMRARLINLAGRVYLAKQGRPEDRRAFAELSSCEDLRLPKAPPTAEPLLATSAAFPPFADDMDLAKTVLPAWMGIQFAGVEPDVRARNHLPSGTALIRSVYPGSPAQSAGLRAGDLVLGPPGKNFTQFNEVRVWTFLSRPGEPRTLDVQRDGKRIVVTLTPGAFPGELPALPGPPKPGSPAPPLSVLAYRGQLPKGLAGDGRGKAHLLFFWATYCGPCKASLPEVLAFGKESGLPVIAVSDEPLSTLNEFFATWKKPFPEIVARDELRSATIGYGTSGVPTFVFVDDHGIIRSYVTGYDPARGIGVPSWKYRGDGAKTN